MVKTPAEEKSDSQDKIRRELFYLGKPWGEIAPMDTGKRCKENESTGENKAKQLLDEIK